MCATEAHLRGNKEYMKTLDRCVFYLPKGKKEEYQKIAIAAGYKSLNAYIVQAIKEKMEREK